MGKYLIKTDYMYILHVISGKIFVGKFYCPQEGRFINSYMCPCFKKEYLEVIGEKIIDIYNKDHKEKYNEDYENSLNELICTKEENHIDFSFGISCPDFNSQLMFDNKIDLFLNYCTLVEKKGLEDEEKNKVLEYFKNFCQEEKRIFNDIKILIGKELKESFYVVDFNCCCRNRRDLIVNCLYEFIPKYNKEHCYNHYVEFLSILADLLVSLDFDESDEKQDSYIFKVFDRFLNSITDNDIYIFD